MEKGKKGKEESRKRNVNIDWLVLSLFPLSHFSSLH